MTQQQTQNKTRSLIKASLLQIEQLQVNLNAVEAAKTEPLAIIGIGCRFPKDVETPESLWELFKNGVDTVTEVPEERWNIQQYYDPNPDKRGKVYCRHGSFLNQVDLFDPAFFEISPRETESLDPQQRLLLEVSWEALENAAIAPDSLTGSQTGVFIGMMNQDYSRLYENLDLIDMHTGTGNSISAAAGRLSHYYGLNGPSLTVDTACSSSLVTVHMACQSLRTGESNLAIAGGVNLILSPVSTLIECRAHMLSAQGRCKTFDASADGFVRGEGCGVVVLKRLSDALAAEDSIWGLIRGSSVNHTGTSGGLTVPSSSSQEKLFRQALANGKLTPEEVGYIEAHGTGTVLGDPIELKAISKVYGTNRAFDNPLIVGSAKTNFGHLEGAAGIIGLLKAILALHHEEIPPQLHFNHPNPQIPWDQLPIQISTELTPWSAVAGSRIAGVSSFGFSGTNAHVLVEEAPVQSQVKVSPSSDRPYHILALSAKSEEALQKLMQSYEQFLADHSRADIADVCFTTNVGRSHFQHRMAIISSNGQELAARLAEINFGRKADGIFFGQLPSNNQPPKIAFLFTGQGSQYVNMGRELYETQPLFRQTLDRCEQILRSYLEKPLLDVLYPQDSQEVDNSLLNQTAYTQPALFSVEYSLFKLWQSWGIQPDVVMGHSIGEYVAATVAGVFSLEDSLKLIAHRGRLMQQLPSEGEMVAVMASESKVKKLIAPYKKQVALAAINGSNNTVISGTAEIIKIVRNSLEAEEIKTRQLQVSHAFHSPLMEPILEEFTEIANQITYSQPRISLISNVTGIIADKSIATADYWVNHIRQPVQFARSIETLYQDNYKIFLEIGSKPILLGMARQCFPDDSGVWLPSLRPNVNTVSKLTSSSNLIFDEWQQILHSLAEMYVQGIKVNWLEFERDCTRKKVRLPTYPFQRRHYWLESPETNHNKNHQFLSSQKETSTLINLLDQKNIRQLTQNIKKKAQLSASEVKLLPKIIESLIELHQQPREKSPIKKIREIARQTDMHRSVDEILQTEPIKLQELLDKVEKLSDSEVKSLLQDN